MSDLNENSKTGSASIPPVSSGKPSVSGRRRKNRSGGMFLAVLALAVLLGVILAFVVLKGSDEPVVEENESAQTSLTSSRELTLPPTPPQEIEEKPSLPLIKEEADEPKVEVQPVVVQQPAPLPLTEGNFDAQGNPIPTLEELKFAAPMMGAVASNTANGAAGGADRSLGLSSTVALNETEATEGRDLARRLRSVATPSTSASRIKNQSLILSKGTVIECILETRVDTTVPGMTTCVIPRNIYSMNGRVLLVEKGTRAIGEYQGSVANGLARIFMLWTELRTPHGISIPLNSPAADALGAAGMGGYVDFHWWKRFGNALLFSLISDGFQYIINTANSNNNNGDVTYENTEDGMDEIIREAMRQSGDIPPTLIKNQGERVSIFVARDLSFENVYGIKAQGNGN